MNDFTIKILVNVVIFIGVFVGFIIYMKKYTNWFEEGGFLYELRKKIKESRKEKNSEKIKKQ